MQLKEFYIHFLNELKQIHSHDEAAAMSNMVFEKLANAHKSTIITQPHRILEKEITDKLSIALNRLKQHEPVQYILGEAWFYDLVFKVSTAVLVPRPETEELVKHTIEFIKSNNNKNLLDIGTGSGCIPISIKKNIPLLAVHAIEVSEDALTIARENAATNKTQIEWHHINFLDENSWGNLPVFDVIVSNPPYIPQNEKEKLDLNVRAHEPGLALFVPDGQPLLFYKKIALFGKKQLAPGGCIFMETHEKFAGEVASHFNAHGYHAVVLNDFYEKERMVKATHSL